MEQTINEEDAPAFITKLKEMVIDLGEMHERGQIPALMTTCDSQGNCFLYVKLPPNRAICETTVEWIKYEIREYFQANGFPLGPRYPSATVIVPPQENDPPASS